MEASKRMMCAMGMMVMLVVGSAEAVCTVKNSSGNDIELMPVGVSNVKIKVRVGAVVEVAPIYLNVVIKNMGTGHKSKPTKLVDGTIVVCVNGAIPSTVTLYLGGLLNGLFTLLAGSLPIVANV